MIDRIITSDNITGSYSHIKKAWIKTSTNTLKQVT